MANDEWLKRARAAWDVLTGKAEARHPVDDPGAVAAAWEDLQPTLQYAYGADGVLIVLGLRGGVIRAPQLERAIAARFPELSERQQDELANLIVEDWDRERRAEAREARELRRAGRPERAGGWTRGYLHGKRTLESADGLVASRAGRWKH